MIKDKVKSKSKGKIKGGVFERDIAKKLSLWFSKSKRDDIFYRSHSSGARFTSRKKSNKDTAYQSGDITCSDPIGEPLINKWSIECKTGYGKWDVLDLIEGKIKKTKLIEFWEQACKDAIKKEPILIFRRKGKGACICIRTKYFVGFSNAHIDNLQTISIIDNRNRERLTLINLDDFLSVISAENICK